MDESQREQGAKLKIGPRIYPIYKGINTIGRNKTAVVNIKSLNVSHNQALIVIVNEVQHFISDMTSANGTYLNDTKLIPFKLYELADSSQIKFGDVKAKYSKMTGHNVSVSSTESTGARSIDLSQHSESFYTSNTQLVENTFRHKSGIHDTTTQPDDHMFKTPSSTESILQKRKTNTQEVEVQPANQIKVSKKSSKALEMDLEQAAKNRLDDLGEDDKAVYEMKTQDLSEIERRIAEVETQQAAYALADPNNREDWTENERRITEVETQQAVYALKDPQNLEDLSEKEKRVTEEETQKVDYSLQNLSLSPSHRNQPNHISGSMNTFKPLVGNSSVSWKYSTSKSSNKNEEIITIDTQPTQPVPSKAYKIVDGTQTITIVDSQESQSTQKNIADKSAVDVNVSVASASNVADKDASAIKNNNDLNKDEADKIIGGTQLISNLETQFSSVGSGHLQLINKNDSLVLERDISKQSNSKSSSASTELYDIDSQSSFKSEKISNRKSSIGTIISRTETSFNTSVEDTLGEVIDQTVSDHSNASEDFFTMDYGNFTDNDVAFDSIGETEPSKIDENPKESDNIEPTQDIATFKKKKLQKLLSDSESDTDVSQDIGKVKKKLKALDSEDGHSNSDTDCDEVLQKIDDVNPKRRSQSDNKRQSDADLFPVTQAALANVTNIEQKGATTSAGAVERKNLKENEKAEKTLNDSDCIPATQDVFAKEFGYEAKSCSEESFRLGISELMEDTISQSSKNESVNNQRTVEKVTQNEEIEDNLNQVPENSKTESEDDIDKQSDANKDLDEDASVVNNSESTNSFLIPTQKFDDEMYMAPTQKFVESENLPGTSRVTQSEDDDIYLLSTQQLTETESQFKVPKKFNFKKKPVSLDESLDSLLGNKKQKNNVIETVENLDESAKTVDEDIYTPATQKLDTEADEALHVETKKSVAAADEFYIPPTQKLDKEVEDAFYAQTTKNSDAAADVECHIQPTRELNIEDDDDDFITLPSIFKNSGVAKDSSKVEMPQEPSELTVDHDYGTLSQAQNLIQKPVESVKDGDGSKSLESPKNVQNNETLDQPETSKSDKRIIKGTPKKLQEPSQIIFDHDYETLSQIEAFIKKPIENITKGGNTNKSSESLNVWDSQNDSETLSQIEAFIKEPVKKVNDENESSKEKITPRTSGMNTRTSRKKVSSHAIEFGPGDVVDLSDDEGSDVKQKKSSVKQDANQTYIELLESKNTKLKKKTTGSEGMQEIKVRVTSHRRSMAIAESSFADVSTRKSKSLVENNEVVPKKRARRKASDDDADFKTSETLTKPSKVKTSKVKEISEVMPKRSTRNAVSTTAEVNVPSPKRITTRRNSKESATSSSTSQNETCLTTNTRSRTTRQKSKTPDRTISNSDTPSSSLRTIKEENETCPKKNTRHRATTKRKIEAESDKDSNKTKTLSVASTSKDDNATSAETPKRKKVSKRTVSEVENDGEEFEETPRRGMRTLSNTTSPRSSERSKRKQRPKVVFTMLQSPILESHIRQLGGTIVDGVNECTVLVTQQVKRTQKLLQAVGQGKPICGPEWIHASKKAGEFLDPWDYILTDKEAEKKWKFSLQESLRRALSNKILENYSFQILTSVAVDVLKGAIEASGGKCVTRNMGKSMDGTFVLIGVKEDRAKYKRMVKQNPELQIIDPEAIFDGVLRQELKFEQHSLC